MEKKRPDIQWLLSKPIAHRGLYSNPTIPENSKLAFQRAIDSGYPIELDIQLTADKEIVVFHDWDLLRLCNDNRYVKDLTSLELKELPIFNSAERIPLLDEVLELVNGQIPLLIELKVKNYTGELENVLCEKLKNYKGLFALQSFHPLCVNHLKKHNANLPCGLLSGSYDCFDSQKGISFLLKNLLPVPYIQPDFISYEYKALLDVSISLVRHFSKIPIIAWTVDNDEARKKINGLCHNFIFENIDV